MHVCKKTARFIFLDERFGGEINLERGRTKKKKSSRFQILKTGSHVVQGHVMPEKRETSSSPPKKKKKTPPAKLCLPVLSGVRGADEVVSTRFPPGRREAGIDRLPQTASKRRLLISCFCPPLSVSLFISLPLSPSHFTERRYLIISAHTRSTRARRGANKHAGTHDCRLINVSDCIQSKSLMCLR